MNDDNLQDSRLSALYRRAASRQGGNEMLESELLAAVAAGKVPDAERARVIDILSRSPVQADLVRTLRALGPDSEMLARSVSQALEHGRPGTPSTARLARTPRLTARHRHHIRPARWAAAAAVVVAALGLWSWRQLPVTGAEFTRHNVVAGASSHALQDGIFQSSMDRGLASQAGPKHEDGLFHSDFGKS